MQEFTSIKECKFTYLMDINDYYAWLHPFIMGTPNIHFVNDSINARNSALLQVTATIIPLHIVQPQDAPMQ